MAQENAESQKERVNEMFRKIKMIREQGTAVSTENGIVSKDEGFSSNMKATDLQIGDWVECTYWTPSKQLKVAEIRRIVDDEIKIGVYCDGLVLIFKQSEVKPIPLTQEILLANGFEKDAETGECLLSDNADTHEVYWIGTILTVQSGYGRMELVNCQYVHELQHALRLCGVNKDIIIKKED